MKREFTLVLEGIEYPVLVEGDAIHQYCAVIGDLHGEGTAVDGNGVTLD